MKKAIITCICALSLISAAAGTILYKSKICGKEGYTVDKLILNQKKKLRTFITKWTFFCVPDFITNKL